MSVYLTTYVCLKGGFGFESRWYHLKFRYALVPSKRFLDIRQFQSENPLKIQVRDIKKIKRSPIIKLLDTWKLDPVIILVYHLLVTNIPGFLLTMDLEKAFDSFEHDILLCVLKKIGFGDNFITCIKLLLNDQQSYVINEEFTTQ